MNAIDVYLAQVKRSMTGMDASVREDILKELRSHLAEAADGGDVGRALADLGPPANVGHKYRKVYGYGPWFQVLFAAIAFLLAIPSSPVLQVTPEFPLPNLLAIPFLAALVAWILWTSVAAGSRAGLFAAATAFAARAVVGIFLALTPPYPAPSAEGLGLFITVGVLLLLVGWLPGTAKKMWTRRGAEL